VSALRLSPGDDGTRRAGPPSLTSVAVPFMVSAALPLLTLMLPLGAIEPLALFRVCAVVTVPVSGESFLF
jgi:hypothetical protein